jgi:hypothetical protein
MAGPRAGKKATPTKKAAANKPRNTEYNLLANASVVGGETHNVYGVIVDATFPYKVSKDRFVCSLKIVDGSLNGSGKKNEWANLVIFANRFEDLPIVHRLGDIIRVHRATMRVYDDRRQFNLNTYFAGSWALFSSDKHSALNQDCSGNQPMSHSHKRASFEKSEGNILAALRKWASGYMASAAPVTAITPLNKAASVAAGKDFDVHGKITQIHEFDEYTNEIRLRDNSGESWYTLCTKLKFPHLRAGQTVYIRSVTANCAGNKNVLAQSHYSNVCTFINGSKAAGALAKVTNDTNADRAYLSGSDMSHAVVVSEVSAKFASMAVTSLRDLFHRADTLSGNTFRVHVQVTNVNGGDCIKNGHWHAELLCKDASTANGNNQYRLLNYSHNGHGAKFFGAASAGAACASRVRAHVANMTRFNSFVDAVVERSNGFYYIKETRLIH